MNNCLQNRIENERIDSICIIRALAILIVVSFHCYGMMYAQAHFPATRELYHSIYFIPNQCVFINLAMPMFVFVSGFLFQYLLSRGKYSTWSNLVVKKIKRIILPFLIFSTLFALSLNIFDPICLIRGSFAHLWFLPALFWCFVLGYALNKLYEINRSKIIAYLMILGVLIISFVGVIVPKFIPMWFGLHNITKWFYWFYLGQATFLFKETLLPYIERYHIHYVLSIIYLAQVVFYPVEYGEDVFANVAAESCGIIAVYLFLNKVRWNQYTWANGIIAFSSYSYGIYIFHLWIAPFLISTTAKRLFPLELLAGEHVILFPLLFSAATLIISFIITYLLLKTKVGKFLIG